MRNGTKNEANEQDHVTKNQIQHVIGVMSGKGGVGKSFVTGLLASGLARQGYQVGILDADFTGSSIPMIFGLYGPVKIGRYSFLPHQSQSGIKIISTNLLFDDEGQSVVWKESLVGNVIKELWKEVEWGALDFLIVDMPPATSEVSVAIMKSLPIKGVIIVTMPQGLTTKIVQKAVNIAKKIPVPIVGVVENMAYYLSPDTGKKYYVFGQSHGDSIATLAQSPMLAQIPLNPFVVELCDMGKIEEVNITEGLELTENFLESLLSLSELENFGEMGVQYDNHVCEFPDNQQNIAADFDYQHRDFGNNYFSGQAFSEKTIQIIQSRENMGTLDHPDAQGHFLGSCGDRMQIDLRLDGTTIVEGKFIADGCGATIACGSMVTKLACSKSLTEAMQITPEELIKALDGLPEDHEHCAELAVMALREAVIDAIEGHRNIGEKLTKQ